MRGGGGRLWAPWAVLLLWGCGEAEFQACQRDDDCGAGALCMHELCVADVAPEVIVVADRRESRVDEEVVVDAGASSGSGPLTFEFRVEPDGAATVVPEGPKARVRRRIPHQDVEVVVEVRNRRGTSAEGRVAIAARNSLPELALQAEPDPFQPGQIVSLSAPASDADGDPLSFSWTLDGPGELAGSGPEAKLHTLPGAELSYPVRVQVSDGMGGQAEAELVLQPRNAAPVLTHEEVAVEHRCEGEPLVCTASAELKPQVEDVGEVHFGWRLLADRPDVAHRFEETAEGVRLDLSCSPACPIAGTWMVEVVATDGMGASSTIQLPVEVTNRPPIVRAHDESELSHRALQDEEGVRYLVAREARQVITWEDPDGDPPAPGSISWTSPSPALHFDDPTSIDPVLQAVGTREEILDLQVAVVAADINGAEAADHAVLPIGNTPPAVTFGGDTREGHRYVRAESDGTRVYRKTISLESLEAEDPDGDPLAITLELDPLDPNAVDRHLELLEEEGTYHLQGVGPGFLERSYLVIVRVADPWGAEARSTGEVLVSNRDPVVVSAPASTKLATGRACESHSCCIPTIGGGACLATPSALVATQWASGAGPLVIDAEVEVSDPDGDPLQLEVAFNYESRTSAQVWSQGEWLRQGTVSCNGAGICRPRIRMPGEASIGAFSCALDAGTNLLASAQVSVRADDGLGGVSQESRWSYSTGADPAHGSCP